MTDRTFTPALGRFKSVSLYDAMISLTRERLWRGLVVTHAAPRPDDVIVDVGCGAGSLDRRLVGHEPELTSR